MGGVDKPKKKERKKKGSHHSDLMYTVAYPTTVVTDGIQINRIKGTQKVGFAKPRTNLIPQKIVFKCFKMRF